MSKNCVISFANQKGNYIKGIERLNESLRNNSEGIDFIPFIGEATLGCEPHEFNPYSFKIAGFKKVRDLGYKNVLWLDSSCFAIKSVQPCFDEIENKGFLMQEAGHTVASYTNNFTLDYFGITRDQAETMLTIGNAGFLGLNFNMPKPNEFFDKWEAACLAGCFKGKWDNNERTESDDPRCKGHRHDLSCSSIIVNQMGLWDLVKSGDTWLQYATVFQETANDTIIFKAAGM